MEHSLLSIMLHSFRGGLSWMSCRGHGVRLGRAMPAALSGRDGGASGGRKVNPAERGEEVCGDQTGELLWQE